MTDAIDAWTGDVHEGDAAATLEEMPGDSVHFAMTSPPYFGLRDYSVDGQIGLEDSLDEYIQSLVAVGRGLRRVLRDDGSWWLNLGDSFAGSWGAQSKDGKANNRDREAYPEKNPSRNASLRRKTKMLVPARVAIALIDDGWIVRNDVPWIKPNPMPESVTDRLSTTFEFVFHLTPQPDYWYDLDAIREPHSEGVRQALENADPDRVDMARGKKGAAPERNDSGDRGAGFSNSLASHPAGKNPGDVFEVTTKPYPDAHFAVYPPELVETPLKATCPPQVCADCGAPYDRIVEDDGGFRGGVCVACGEPKSKHVAGGKSESSTNSMRRPEQEDNVVACNRSRHVGWEPTCDCDTDATEPGIALDPFAGSGTTCAVAREHGRRFVGIDLSAEYIAMAQKRIGVDVDEPSLLRDDDQVGFDAFAASGGGGDP